MTQFSIVIPTFNRANRLQACLDSILQQTFSDFEIIVVDDGSTDDTQQVVENTGDSRITYHYKKNEERAIARNTGIDLAKGEYVTFLDSDDLMYPHHLAEAKRLIEVGNPSTWLHLNYEIKDDLGNVLRKGVNRTGDLGASLVTGNHLSCIGVFVRRDVIKENQFDEHPDLIGSEDYELWLRLAHRFPLAYSNVVTAAMIQHPVRSVMGFSEEKLRKRIKYIVEKEEREGFFTTQRRKKFRAHRLAYMSLHLAMSGSKRGAWAEGMRAIREDFCFIFTRKSVGVLWKLLTVIKS